MGINTLADLADHLENKHRGGYVLTIRSNVSNKPGGKRCGVYIFATIATETGYIVSKHEARFEIGETSGYVESWWDHFIMTPDYWSVDIDYEAIGAIAKLAAVVVSESSARLFGKLHK